MVALEAALYASRRSKRGHRRVAEPDWAGVHRELKRKHVTLLILWDEYIAANPGGYSYSRFCELYRSFEKTLSVTMRQTHAAGELRQIHPRQQARSEAGAQAPRGHGSDPPSQHPRAALLPLGDANLLRHPTLDQLYALGLHGMAKAFVDLSDADEPNDPAHADWLALLLDRETSWRRDKRLTARLRAAKLRQQASVEDVDYRAARVSIAPCSKGSPRETGSTPTTISPWSAQPASAKAGWPAPSATEPAATIAPSSIIAGQSSARTWRSPEATAAIRASSNPSAAPICSFSTTSASNPSTPAPVMICSKFSRSDTAAGRRSSPPSSPCLPGMRSLATPLTPTPILDRLVHNAHRIELTGESLRRARGKQNKPA
jgi:IstB-like ATP binding protein